MGGVKELDGFKRIEKYDESSMLELIESFPEQCQDAKCIGDGFELPQGFKRSYKNIICTGLGGSAIGADIVRSYISADARIPVSVNRNYTLPNFVAEDTLAIVSSYSGNTEETLSAYREAVSRNSSVIVITSGGKLEKAAKKDNLPCLIIPEGFPPRCALGYSFFPLLTVLAKIGIIKDQAGSIDDAMRNLRKLRDSGIGYKIPFKNNLAKKTAAEIFGKFPVIYASQDRIDAVVTRWRGQLAENSKTLSSGHLFPEMNHNEIVGWENPKKVLKDCVAIILRDVDDHPRISMRMDVTRNLLRKGKAKVLEISSSGRGLLARIFSLIYIGDYVSFYLAILNGIDPTPVNKITYLKKEMAKI
ncbi:MAG: bifunctional phosphoglucose/phosphomannose isomerase [Candidatus Omnitrophica bacterium]|nr:bifunctional phosphoglucose/phosphomannose isomerase [Candidatus Omnitrophota bacterium]